MGSRRLLHFGVTEHVTAEWTLQQLRETLPGGRSYRFVIHDKGASFTAELDRQVRAWVFGVAHTCANADGGCVFMSASSAVECPGFHDSDQ
jgi:hypothetical protein